MASIHSPARSLFTAVAAMAVCIGYGRFSLGLLLPAMKDDLDITYAVSGLLASLNLAAYLVGVWVTPRLSGRVSLVQTAQAGLALAAAGMVLLAIPGPLVLVPLALTLTGLAGALGWVSGAAIGARLAPAGRRGLVMGIIGAANGIGILTSSVLALVLVGDDGRVAWRLVWLVQAGLAAATLLPALRAPRLTGVVLTVPQRPRRLWGLTAAYACFGVGYAWFATYYVASVEDNSHVQGAAMWAVVGLGALVGSILFGTWSDRWGRRQVLVVSQVVATAACAVMMTASGSIAGGVVGGLLFGSVLTGMATLVPAALADMVGTDAVAATFASLTLAFAMAQTVSPVVGGLVVDHAPGGFATLYGCSAVTFVLASVLFGRHVVSPAR